MRLRLSKIVLEQDAWCEPGSRMSVVNDSESEVRREAVAWVQRLDAGRVTHSDLEALKRWRAQSPAHEAAFVDARRLWRTFTPAARNMRARGDVPRELVPPKPGHSALSRRALIGSGLAAASVAVAYAAVHPPLDLWPSLAALRADYRTATGEQRNVALAGDMSLQLNTRTSVALHPPDGRLDRLELIAGEASFLCGPRQARGLIVRAADGTMTTDQARFDVRRNDQSVRVICIEGEVSVTLGAQAAMLGPGQQVSYERDIGRTVPADIELVTAWQQGVLIFRMTPLAEVVEEINRYRSGRVILADRTLADMAVSGRFPIGRMDEILMRLNQAFGVTSRALPGGIVLLG